MTIASPYQQAQWCDQVLGHTITLQANYGGPVGPVLDSTWERRGQVLMNTSSGDFGVASISDILVYVDGVQSFVIDNVSSTKFGPGQLVLVFA